MDGHDAGGHDLVHGVVDGVPRSRALLNRLVAAMNENFSQMSRHLEDVLKELKQLPENERIKALGKELERLADEAARAGEKTRNHIQQEILPKLKEEVDRLKKELEKKAARKR